VVDDDEQIIKLEKLHWETCSQGRCEVEGFLTARSALDEILRRIEFDLAQPDIIFVDGNLELDQGDLTKGSELVKRIKSLDIRQPILVAFSHNEDVNKLMGTHYQVGKAYARAANELLLKLVDHAEQNTGKP